MNKIFPLVSLALAIVCFTGCAVQRPLATRFDPCHRVRIDPAPIWTASAAFTPEEDRVLLVGPERRSLLVYNLEGELEREIELDPLAEFEYSVPVRLEATDDGYLLGSKTQILWLDRDFAKRRLWKPFEHLKKAGVAGGSISDFTVLGRTVYAFADFLWDDEATPAPRQEPEVEIDPYEHVVPGTDQSPGGNWFRGFAKIDLENPEVVTLHRFELEDREFERYYLYAQRPYVMDLDKRAYVLRYTDPPQVFRAPRKASSRRGLEPFYSGSLDDDFKTLSLYAWEGRLYLLGYRRVDDEGSVVERSEPTAPQLIRGMPSRAQLLAMQKGQETKLERLLVEIDPKTGQALRKYRLPAENSAVKLVPGKSFWAMIEESATANIRPEDKVHLTLLPSSWLQGPRTAHGGSEVVLECPVEG